ncbi:hypothetical protein CDAR_570051 [Caerostris darwini]|uniref:Uncharacterized protein n=1 Tax=Caerostris darwini TaxID=1538125 RepID=A0AAV4RZT4_9ARAC|nr:hypothetical protein CDAR_570051 [Caerostris darwini]
MDIIRSALIEAASSGFQLAELSTVAAAILVFMGTPLLIPFNPDSQLLEIWENVIFPPSALRPGGHTLSPRSLIGRWEQNGKNGGRTKGALLQTIFKRLKKQART